MAEDTRQHCGAGKLSGSPDSAVFLSDPEEDCCRDDDDDAPVFFLATPGGDAANPSRTGCRCRSPDPSAVFAQGGGGLDARRLSLLKSLSQDSEYSLDSGGGALFAGGGAEAYLEELGFAGAAYPTIPDRFLPSLIERMADEQLGGGGLNERILLSIGRFRRSLGKRRLFRQLSAGRPCHRRPPLRRLCPDDAAPPLQRSNTGPSSYSDERLPSEEVRRHSGVSRGGCISDPDGRRGVCEAPVVAIRISDADGQTVTATPDMPDATEGSSAPRDSESAKSDGRRDDAPSRRGLVSSSALDSESDSSRESRTRCAPRAPSAAAAAAAAAAGALATDCSRNALEQDAPCDDDSATAVTTITGKEGRVQDQHCDVNDVTKEHCAEVPPLQRTETSGSVSSELIHVSDSGSDADLALASGSNISRDSSCVPVPTRTISLAKNSIADTKLFSFWNSANRTRDVDSEVISNGKESRFPFDEESSVSKVPGASPPAQPSSHCRQEEDPSRRMSVAQNPLPSQPGLTDKTHVVSNTLKYIPPDDNNLSELKSPEIVKLLNRPFHADKNEYARSDSLQSFMSSMLHDNRPPAVPIPQPNVSNSHTDIAKDNFGETPHRGLSDPEPVRDDLLYDAAYRLEAADVQRVQSEHRSGRGIHSALRVHGETSETERPDGEVGASGDRRSKEDPQPANRRKRPRLRRMSTSLEQPDDPCDDSARGNSPSGTSRGQDAVTPADPIPLRGCADNPSQTVDARSAALVPRRVFPEEVFHHCFRALSWDSRTSPSGSVQRDIPSDHGPDGCTFLSETAGERHESSRSRNVSSAGLPKTTLSNDEKRDTKRLHDINELNGDSCRSSYVHLVPQLPDQATHRWDASSVLHPPNSSFEGQDAFQRSIPTSSNWRSFGQRSSTEVSASSSYDFFSFRKKFSETKDLDAMNRKSPLLRRACPAQNETTRSTEAVRDPVTEKRHGAEEEPVVPRSVTFEAIEDHFSRAELLASNRCLSNERLDVDSAHSHDLTNRSYTLPQRILREGHDRPSISSPPGSVAASEPPSKRNDPSTGLDKQAGGGMQGEEQQRPRDLLRRTLGGQEGARPLERSDSASAEFVRSHRNPGSRTETAHATRVPNAHESGKAILSQSSDSDDGRAGRSGVREERTTGPAAEDVAPRDSPDAGSRDVPSPYGSDLSRNLAAESSPPEGVVRGRRAGARPEGAPGVKREPLLERKMRIFAKLLSHLVFLVPGGGVEGAAPEGGAAGRRRASEALLCLLGIGPAAGGGAVVEPRAFGSGVRLAVNADGGREGAVFVSSVCMEVVPADPGGSPAMWHGDRRADRQPPPRGLRSASRELEELRAAIRKAKESRMSASRELFLLQELLLRSAGDEPPRCCPAEQDGDEDVRSTSEGTPDPAALSDLRSKSKRDVLEDTRLFQEEVKKVKQETDEAWSARLERMESRLQLQEQELARLREENRRPSPSRSSDPPSPTQGRRSACCGRLSEQLSRAERRADELGLLLDQKLIELNKLQIALSAQTKEMIELEKAYVQLQCRLRRGAGKPSALGRLCARTFAPPRSPRPGV